MVKKQPVLVLVLLLALVLTLAPVTGGAGVAQPAPPTPAEDLERAYLRHMIMHHHAAVLMAQPVVAGAVHEELRALAQDIIATQSAEIAQMHGWLMEWYAMSPPMGPMGPGMGPGMPPGAEGMGMPPGMPMPPGMMPGMPVPPDLMPGMEMPGMELMAPEMMRHMADMGMGMMDMMSLPGLSGERLEIAFMLLMIAHHQDAVTKSEQALGQMQRVEMRELARQIIVAQTAEIQQLNTWLAAWYGL
jgi:uncharacterized protein (DUF305 family)